MNALLFVLLVAALFSYPSYPSFGLDPSWSMALGQFFHDGLQFGPEVTFTYGPLGFLLANTYMGLHFWSLIFWQTLTAVTFAIVIIDSAQRLPGIRRIIYFAFFLVVGSLSYTEALSSIIITMIGFELLRRSGEDGLPSTYLLVLFLALLASTKFTLLILASFSVLIVGVQALLRGRWHIALLLSSCFLAGYLALWLACVQNFSNLHIYMNKFL
jgi:hypothetical protein